MKTVSRSAVIVAAVIVTLMISGTLLLGRPQTSAATQSPESRETPTTNVSPLQKQIIAKEREGLDALKTGNLDLFAKLTSDEAVFVDAHGLATKAQVITNVAGFKLTDYSMEGLRFVPLSKKSGLISYKISEKGVSHGKEFAAQAYVSSIWEQRKKGEWVCLFSQETGAR
jgi:Domain of unknown function (DUF4440)